ncbi:ABC transporter permease [Nakamurella flava]|nr:ABC transporter permease [Nakamurella flava]
MTSTRPHTPAVQPTGHPTPTVAPRGGGGPRAFRSLSAAMFKGFYRDRLSVGFSVLFPLFFILIFGTVLSGGAPSATKVVQVGAVPLIDQLPAQARQELGQALEITSADSLADAVEQVRKGEVAAVVQQDGDTLSVQYSSADQVTAATVRGIFDAFVNAANIAATGAPPTYTLQTSQVEDESLQAIQFIAPGMIGYGIAIGAVFGAAMTLITWREKKLLRRLRLAPVSTVSVVASRVVVSIVVALVQLVLFVGVSMLPFLGLRLSGAWYMAVPLTIAGTLAFLAIGLFVGSVAKTVEGGSGLANLITLPMAFVSGAFIPADSGPEWMTVVAKFLPLSYLVDGLKDVLVRGEGPAAAVVPIVVMLGFAVAVTLVATRFFRWDTA